jgi:hypothetical protein
MPLAGVVQEIDEPLIGVTRLPCEARNGTTHVGIAELRAGVDRAGEKALAERTDPIDEMIRIVGDSVTDPTHQANAPKFPDRRRRPDGRR